MIVPKRVVIYGMNYAPEIAGVGRYTGEIGEHLAAEGHEVCVVTTPPHYPGWRTREGYRNGWSHELQAGVAVYRCPLYLHEQMGGIKRFVAPFAFALSSAPVAFWQIVKRRPDIVIAIEPTLFVAPLALLAARLVGARTMLHVQDLEVEAAFAVGHLGAGGRLSRLAAVFDQAMARSFDRIITISERMAEKIRAKGVAPSRVKVVRNWVDLERIRPDLNASAYRRELDIADDVFVVLYSGNLGAKQGVRLLIEAARRLVNQPDIIFLIAGDGPMRGEVERAAAELPNLRQIGFQPEDRFGQFLRVADLHVLPQEREAADLLLPSKLGGMLASGRPVLVTADPGTELAEFLGTSCQFSPPGDADGLAAAIGRAVREIPCPDKEAQRLALAKALSKNVVIDLFAQAALFLDGGKGADAGREAS